MCAEVAGTALVVPIAPSRSGDPRRCRPIGCYRAAKISLTNTERPTMNMSMTPDEEYEFYSRPENQEPERSAA